MTAKRVLRPSRQRRLPAQFSWVDQRLVREGYGDGCEASAWALYLFLVTVADKEGLSFYADGSIGRHLSLSVEQVIQARQDLMEADLIAYQRPLYQVLSLESPSPGPRAEKMQSVGQMLRQALEGRS